MTEKTKSNLARNIVAVIIMIVWIVALYEKYRFNFELPFSVELGITVVLSYVFGTTAIKAILDYWRKK